MTIGGISSTDLLIHLKNDCAGEYVRREGSDHVGAAARSAWETGIY